MAFTPEKELDLSSLLFVINRRSRYVSLGDKLEVCFVSHHALHRKNARNFDQIRDLFISVFTCLRKTDTCQSSRKSFINIKRFAKFNKNHGRP